MTPLAMRVTRSWMADEPSLDWRVLADLHCFDLTEVIDLVEDLKGKMLDDMSMGRFDPVLAFLPAPRTWIECRMATGRFGWMLVSGDIVLSAKADLFVFGEIDGCVTNSNAQPLLLHTDKPIIHDNSATNNVVFGLYAMLAIINSPHLLERRVHHPHKGLQRDLNRRFGRGNFPLNAWTEIRLAVDPKVTAIYGEEGVSNRKALHFCRAHLRIKRGRLEHVTAHWRGDPSRGVKRSRYSLVN